jgi:hypothetical protein
MYINADEKIHSRIGIGDDAPMKVRTVEELYKLCQEGKDVYVHLGQVWKKIHIVAADDALKTTCIAITRSHYKVEHLCSNDTRFMTAIKTGAGNNSIVQIEAVCAAKLKKTTILLENSGNYFSGKEILAMSYISEKNKNVASELELYDVYIEPAWNPCYGDDFNRAFELSDGLIIDCDEYASEKVEEVA